MAVWTLSSVNGIDTMIEDFRKVRGWDNPEIMDAVKGIELALENHDSEIAYQAGDKYITIQTVDDGYDYTFYDQNFRGLDGGVYDDPDTPIKAALEEILSDEGIDAAECKVIPYDSLQEQVEEIQQQEFRKGLSVPDKTETVVAGAEPKISFYVAECMEFPVLGEFHENLSLDEAMELYDRIPEERMNGIKGIGFCLEDGSMYDGNFELMSGGRILKDIINDIPHYQESPLVQKAITDMEMLLSEQEKRSQKAAETEKDISRGTGKKQSVLNALRERQTKLKAQEQSGEQAKTQEKKKGDPEL
ncbi:LPD16 domain-containing protein [Lacrimispora xylanisolvens]|uniref:LPD16 domain-containing protein n=1 Tax=Lacrimispora xylanisolvens TaxID=384636 RepID=UPI0032E7FBA4